jgi:hypothetical protein
LQLTLNELFTRLHGGLARQEIGLQLAGSLVAGRQLAMTIEQTRIGEGSQLPLTPGWMVPGGVPEWQGGCRRLRIFDQGPLQHGHWQLSRQATPLHAEGGGQASSLAQVEDLGLQPCGAIGHVTHAETLFGRQQIVDVGTY